VPLLLVTVVAVVVMLFVTRGSLSQLARIPVRAWWLLLGAFAIQIALEYIDFPKDQIETVGFGILMLSYALLLAFAVANLRLRGMWIITLGIALNALVIGLNQGMPTKPVGEDAHGRRIRKPVEQTVKHRQESKDDILGFLGDKIVLPNPFDEVVSAGDIILCIGLVDVCYYASRRNRARRRLAVDRSVVTDLIP